MGPEGALYEVSKVRTQAGKVVVDAAAIGASLTDAGARHRLSALDLSSNPISCAGVRRPPPAISDGPRDTQWPRPARSVCRRRIGTWGCGTPYESVAALVPHVRRGPSVEGAFARIHGQAEQG